MILTPTQLRQFVDFPTGDDADRALSTLLAATEADIEQVVGSPVGAVSELVRGGFTTVTVSRPILAVTGITDDVYGYALTLASGDYRFVPGGFVLHREWLGPYPGDTWGPWVSVTYTAADDFDRRAVVQVGLVKAMLNHNPGIIQQAIGDWSEQYATATDYLVERGALLATLTPGPRMAVL